MVDDNRIITNGTSEPQKLLTPEVVMQWQAGVRGLFENGAAKKRLSPEKAWVLVDAEMRRVRLNSDDIDWCREIVLRIKDATVAGASRMCTRYQDRTPLIDAINTVLCEN